MKRMYAIIPALLLLLAAGVVPVSAQRPDKETVRAEKQARKEEKKRQQEEIRRYQHLRDEAVVEFAKGHQPSAVLNPFSTDFSISDMLCAGDSATGTVMFYFKITSRWIYDFRLVVGGAHNGTQAVTPKQDYPAANYYGFRYNIDTNMPEQIVVTFYNVERSVKSFERIDVSVGIGNSLMNRISMLEVPVFWTTSDTTIREYVRSGTNNTNQNN